MNRKKCLGLLIVVAGSLCANLLNAQIVADKPWSMAADPSMLQRHEAIVAQIRSSPKAKIIFIGDSITQFWEREGKAVWDKYYAPRNALNLGLSGDRTNGCLWRLDNGELDGIKPKLAVILIGTNNTWGDEVSVESNVNAIKLIVEKVKMRLPTTQILLLGLFPREDPNTNGKWKLVNQQLAMINFGNNVEYVDINGSFLDDQGRITRGFLDDKLHLSSEGYRIWAEAIEPKVVAALSRKAKN